MCITFITAFKRFDGLDLVHQKSALFSWSLNTIPFIAPINEDDTKENLKVYSNGISVEGVRTAEDLGFKNKSPIVKDLIKKSLKYIETPYVALINSDVIIPTDFLEKMKYVFYKLGPNIFLAGTRYDIDLKDEIKTKEDLKDVWNMPKKIYDIFTSSDIFIGPCVFFKDLAEAMPEFILGRYAWDNWIHLFAQLYDIPKYNCTEVLPTLHCRHDHNHIKQYEGKIGKEAPSSIHNLLLWKGWRDKYGTVRINHWSTLEV